MTAEKFIQSFESYQTGDKGFCRLASISTEKENIMYIIGFWFEIIKSDGKIMVLTVQLNSTAKESYRNTFFIGGESQLETFIDNLRLKAQERIYTFLSHG